MNLSFRAPLLALALASLTSTASATPGPATGYGTPRIDPRADMLFGHRARFGTTVPAFRRSVRFEREGTIPVVVRFTGTPRAETLTSLASAGVQWARAGRAFITGAYGARVNERAMAALERESTVARVEVDLPLAAPRPLDVSVRETMIDTARRAVRLADGTELDGHGVIIADVDSPLFQFHPALYRADGGAFSWIDVNGDGAFTPGTDAVDLDRNGAATPDETLSPILSNAYDLFRRTRIGPAATTFRPAQDWLYIDTNGNGHRDYGQGFDESTPAYGEPLFVADDANHNGTLDPSERVLRLNTSKVRAVLADAEYHRGDATTPLISYNVTTDANTLEASLHGTGVAGILVGGVPGITRWLGLAPGAELIVADDVALNNTSGTTGALQWAVDQGANVIVTEYAPYAGVTLDGTSEEELLLDSAVQHNIIAVSPAGNLAPGHKHVVAHLHAGDNTIATTTDSAFAGATFMQFSAHYRAMGRVLSVAVVLPDGTHVSLPYNARGVSIGHGITEYGMQRDSMRGTSERHFVLYDRAGHASGDYQFVLTLDAGADVDADLYVGDDRTDWAQGFTFVDNEPTRTLCHPATSDQTIAVAAYTLHTESGYNPYGPLHARAPYSSLGPRIDGDPGLDLSAPDNPMSITAPSPSTVPYGSTTPFGGTSGAGPHVAAAAALLRQRFPDETGAQLRARLIDHARHDEFATGDNVTELGHGKLDVAAAMGVTAATSMPPVVTLSAPAQSSVGGGVPVTVAVTDDGAADAVRVRWDTDYDGTPDTDWIVPGTQTVSTPTLGFAYVRVEARDADGNVSAATARIEVVNAPVMLDAGNADASVDAGAGGGHSGCGCNVPANARGGWRDGVFAMVAAAVVARGSRRRRRG